MKVKITREIEVEIAPNADLRDADLGYTNLNGVKISDLDQLVKSFGIVVH